MRVEQQDAFRWYVDAEGDCARYPSVTSVLGHVYRKIEWSSDGAWWMSDGARKFYLERGKLVHKGVYLIASGQGIKSSSVDPIIAPYLAQFEDFALKCRAEFRGAELEVLSKKYGYAGREDLDAVLGSGRRRKSTTLDVKTGKPDRLVGPQTWAYWHAHGEMRGEWNRQRAVLYLNGGEPDGWKLRILNDLRDARMFLSALVTFSNARELGCLSKWTNPELFDLTLKQKERVTWQTPEPNPKIEPPSTTRKS